MENKPIVTCHGDQTLISKLHPLIKKGLPREVVEWRRSYGRPVRNIRTDANFVPYKPDLVPREDNWVLLGRAFFHIYWTECDIDTYKSTIKDEISEWLACLKSRNIADWLIVIVVNDESKVKTKILRTSVMDKVKSDFCSKQQDRCAVLQEPFKPDSKSSESWSKLFMLMRQHILQSFNSSLNRFEEHMRLQREKRQEPDWTFNHYFLLQEELAFMFEMLGLYEDALVQYDELDALFTQFVLNHAAGDTTEWLQRYTDNTPTRWDSIQLSKPIDFSKRGLIRNCKDSILDFRNYLFLRQATLLFLLQKPWEVAERALPFMHNCQQELHILELKLPKGGSACWVFLTCLEIVKTCENYTTGGKMVDTYSLHMAVLWDYARKKLYELGGFCGLLPESEKENLTLVVDLIAGFTLSEDTDALIKLREALSSKASFTKHYLELSELAMGTYKHIGRMRSAKLICKDLADFYINMGNFQKAESYLQDALKIYVQEGWSLLADNIRISIYKCQKQLDSLEKYIRTCAHLSASPTLPFEKRKYYQGEMLDACDKNEGSESDIYIPTKPVLLISQLLTKNSSFLVTEESIVNMMVHLSLPEPLHCDYISASLAFHGLDNDCITNSDNDSTNSQMKPMAQNRHQCNLSGRSFGSFGSLASTGSIDILNPILLNSDSSENKIPLSINLMDHYEYSPNKRAVVTSSLKSKMKLKRIESGNKMIVIDKEVEKGDYSLFMEVDSKEGGITLKPGENKMVLRAELSEQGMYTITQLCFQVAGVKLLRNIPVEEVYFYVQSHRPELNVKTKEDKMYAGVYEPLTVQVSGGTEGIDYRTQIYVTYPSQFLRIRSRATKMKNRCIELSPLAPGETREVTLYVKAQIQLQGTQEFKEQLNLTWKPLDISSDKQLTFCRPVKIHHQLHTASRRKFLQCVVQSISDLTFDLVTPRLVTECQDVEFVSFNKADKRIEINSQQNASYMWELKTNITGLDLVLACALSVNCSHNVAKDLARGKDSSNFSDFEENVIDSTTNDENPTSEVQDCHYAFTLENYKTLYSIQSSVLLPETEKMFNIGKKYTFSFNVKTFQSEKLADIVYVITYDTTEWECSGQNQGLVKLEEGVFKNETVKAVPKCLGYLSHPHVHLYQVKEGWSKAIESNTTQKVPLDIEDLQEQGILISLTKGRVYYASLAQRTHIVEEKNIYDNTLLQSEVQQKMTFEASNKATLQVVDNGPL